MLLGQWNCLMLLWCSVSTEGYDWQSWYSENKNSSDFHQSQRFTDGRWNLFFTFVPLMCSPPPSIFQESGFFQTCNFGAIRFKKYTYKTKIFTFAFFGLVCEEIYWKIKTVMQLSDGEHTIRRVYKWFQG